MRIISVSESQFIDRICSMKGYDPSGQKGPSKPLPDNVTIIDPAPEKDVAEPTSDNREQPAVVAPPAEEPAAYQQPENAGFEVSQEGF